MATDFILNERLSYEWKLSQNSTDMFSYQVWAKCLASKLLESNGYAKERLNWKDAKKT